MNITVNTLTLAPALVPMVAAVVALIADVLAPKRVLVPWLIAALGLLGGGAGLALQYVEGERAPRTLCLTAGECYWRTDRPGMSLQAVALLSAVVVVALAAPEKHTVERAQHSLTRAVMILSATAGCVGVVAAHDVASWLVMLELATLPGVVLAALTSGRKAVHGALTLLATALLSFAVLALGVALWFAATGSPVLNADAFVQAHNNPAHRPLLVVAMMLMLAGVAFKLSLAPFHSWTPETFAGSGAWVSAFLGTTSKVGALGAMLVLLRAASAMGSSVLIPLGLAAVLSMTVGNVMALRSDGVLRFLAWSTVSQAGWVVIPMTVVSVGSVAAASSYLALYAIGTLAVFVVVAAFESADARAPMPSGPVRDVPITALAGMFRSHPLMAGTMALGLLSLAGLPPSVVGVVAKVIALKPAVAGGVWWVVILAVVNAMLGVAVYLRWIIAMMRPAQAMDQADVLPKTPRIYLVLAAFMSLVIIVLSVAPHLLLMGFPQ